MAEAKIRAKLVGDRVVVFKEDDAKRLYQEGFYGKPFATPKPRGLEWRGPLELDPIEAVYLVEKGRLEVVDSEGKLVPLEKLVEWARRFVDRFDMLYRVYRELRDAGFVVRSGLKYGADFALYIHGPGIDHAPYLVQVLGYREYIDPLEIVRAGRLSHSVRKKFVIAAVNEATGKVTYLMFEWLKL